MLQIKESITLTGVSMIEDNRVEGYQAVIDSDNPEDMTLSSWQEKKDLYKANREQCRLDQVAFEEAAYAKQDELIAKKGVANESK